MKGAIIVFLLTLTLSIAFVKSTSCIAGRCDTVRCANLQPEDCQPGTQWVPRYGPCGCCSGCVKLLQFGEECVPISDATEICDRGLVCKPNRSHQVGNRSRKTRCRFADFY